MNNANYKISSYLASPIFIGVALGVTLLCAWAGFVIASGYALFLCLLAACAYLWGRCSADHLTADIKAPRHHVYPGQTVEMACTLQNDKALPLVWLEWVQPYPPHGCLCDCADFEVCDITNPQASDAQMIDPVLRKKFSFVRWYQCVNWTSRFYAARRGVYAPREVTLYTGDGFGLSARKTTLPLATPPVFVVYPARVAVGIEPFFNNAWSATTGPQGTLEDVTVLRGTREYQQSDSFKRMNWRLAARGGELTVNLYETIAPRSVYFLLDTATFAGSDAQSDAFEETLSVLGSLIEALFAADMQVGLYLTNSHAEDDTSTHLHHASVGDCLFALAQADCTEKTATFHPQSLLQLCANQSGNLYYICYDAAHSTAAPLLESVGIASFEMIQSQPVDESAAQHPAFMGQKTHLLSDFRR